MGKEGGGERRREQKKNRGERSYFCVFYSGRRSLKVKGPCGLTPGEGG